MILRFKKVLAALVNESYRHALTLGVGVSLEHRAVLRRITCNSVIDIGANRGQFSLIARGLFPTARIFAFEPLPSAALVFRQIHKADERVVLHEAAIGPERGRMQLHISNADDSSSLLPITDRQISTFPGTEEKGQVEVAVGPLGEWVTVQDLQAPALLKIDTQGFELEVLRGCNDLLALFQWVYVESSFVELYGGQALAGDVVYYLVNRGFNFSGIYNLSFDRAKIPIQGDFLFEKVRS